MAVEKLIFGKLPVSRGLWLQSTLYYKYNIVTLGSSSFMSVWDGEPFSGIMYKPGVFIDPNGNYIITINGQPQGANTTYWQLIAYGIDEAAINTRMDEGDENVKSQLRGLPTDNITSNTILGLKNALLDEISNRKNADVLVKNELTGDPNDPYTSMTLHGVRNYATTISNYIQNSVIGTDNDQPDSYTIHGVRKRIDQEITTRINSDNAIIGTDNDDENALTLKGIRLRVDVETQNRQTADNNLDAKITGTNQDTIDTLTLHGLKKRVDAETQNRQSSETNLDNKITGTDQDTKADLTLKGLKAYCNDLAAYADSKVSDVEFDPETGILSAVFTTFN